MCITSIFILNWKTAPKRNLYFTHVYAIYTSSGFHDVCLSNYGRILGFSYTAYCCLAYHLPKQIQLKMEQTFEQTNTTRCKNPKDYPHVSNLENIQIHERGDLLGASGFQRLKNWFLPHSKPLQTG